jgi:molybdopterin-synthase adenylyltransferase
MALSFTERYSRQIRYSGVGEEGQQHIARARVAVVGCGALGGAQAEILARAGTGFLRVIDRDYVEISNLQRQFLFDEADAAEGLPKAVAAARRLGAANSLIEIEPIVDDLTPSNASGLLGDVDLILDGTDNFETRYLINDLAVSRGIPWIYGAAVGSYGLKMSIVPQTTPCLACVYPEPPSGVQPTCETAGVLAPVTLAIASLQCADALLILSGHADRLSRTITTIDVWTGEIRQAVRPSRDPQCAVCGKRNFRHLDARGRAPISLCGRDAVQIHERSGPVDLQELARQLAPVGGVRANEFALRATIDAYELTVFPDGRAIIKGTSDVGVARSLYARYIGS